MANTKSKIIKLDYFSYIKAFFNLMKPRVMSLVIFTSAVGLLIAPIKIRKKAVVGAGSDKKKNVKDKSLSLTRATQVVIKNYKRK